MVSPNLAGPLMPPGPVGVRTRTRSQHTMLFMTCRMAPCSIAALLPGIKRGPNCRCYTFTCSASMHKSLKTQQSLGEGRSSARAGTRRRMLSMV
jgi:hypothetical protein